MAGRGSPRPARSAQEANDETRPFLSLTFLIFTGSSQTGASRRHVCQGCYEPPSAPHLRAGPTNLGSWPSRLGGGQFRPIWSYVTSPLTPGSELTEGLPLRRGGRSWTSVRWAGDATASPPRTRDHYIALPRCRGSARRATLPSATGTALSHFPEKAEKRKWATNAPPRHCTSCSWIWCASRS
jgi:hypothetical protein